MRTHEGIESWVITVRGVHLFCCDSQFVISVRAAMVLRVCVLTSLDLSGGEWCAQYFE
jgi:hypothetical protein